MADKQLESWQKYMIEKQEEIKVKLAQYNKCMNTWSRIDSAFKTVSIFLTISTTIATAITGGLMVPIMIPTVLAAITAIQTSSCGLVAMGFTSKKKLITKRKQKS